MPSILSRHFLAHSFPLFFFATLVKIPQHSHNRQSVRWFLRLSVSRYFLVVSYFHYFSQNSFKTFKTQIRISLDELKKLPFGFPETSVKSVRSFEAWYFLYIFKNFHVKPSVYDVVVNKPVLLIGPVVPKPCEKLKEKCANWLV